MRFSLILLLHFLVAIFSPLAWAEQPIPPLPKTAKLVLAEDWSSGKIDPERWYSLRKQWGQGNRGVVPENIEVTTDILDGKEVHVLQCWARGDQYDGDIKGLWGKSTRVGGVLVSRQHLASGRFEVTMKIGSAEAPRPPGIVPAIWTYGYRAVKVPEKLADDFNAEHPLYHPYLQQWAKGLAFYWSELDFPEFGKDGDYATPMYNTFLNKQHHSQTFPVNDAANGSYHTYTTEWRTHLVPLDGIKDTQVEEAEGYWWIQDKSIPFERYWGNPLRKLGPNQYAVCAGKSAKHWIDGRYIGENTKFVPSMAAQLNIGVWLPEWAGPAPWESVSIFFGPLRVWQYGDKGDVIGILKDDITDSFGPDGIPLAN